MHKTHQSALKAAILGTGLLQLQRQFGKPGHPDQHSETLNEALRFGTGGLIL